MTFRVGLTGGIGVGKSTVAELFAQHGVPIIDADVVARQVVEPGRPALAEIVSVFGPEVLDAQGALRRAELRQQIFRDPQKKAALEAILHPQIYAEMEQQLTALRAAYVILAVPLLIETGQLNFVQHLLVVDAAPEIQLQRVMARDHLTATDAGAIIRSQVSQGDRLKLADDIIVNDGDLADLQQRVDSLHQRYAALANTDFPTRPGQR